MVGHYENLKPQITFILFSVPRWFCGFLDWHNSSPWDWVPQFSTGLFLSFSPCWYFCVLEIIWLTIILGRHRIHICLILLSRYIPVSNCSIACMQTALFSQTKRKTRLIELPNEDFASGRCLNVNLSYGPLACSPFNARVLAILQLLWTCLPLIFNVMQYQKVANHLFRW